MVIYHCKTFFLTYIIFIVITGGFRIYSSIRNQNSLLTESDLTFEAIEKALTYLWKRPQSLTDDVIFGVFITRANLQWISSRLKSQFDYKDPLPKKLNKLMRICNDIISINKTPSILNKSIWKSGAEDLTYGTLYQRDDDFVLPKFDSYQSIDTYMMKGTPEDSDFCIGELFNYSCQISDNCWLSEVNDDFHSGYKTSHRLIYFQIAARLGCEKINPKKFSSNKAIRKKLCQQMLLEARALHEDLYFPLTRDLFLEQIALCGLEGYGEFAPEIWREEVRNWQNKNGCFGQDMQFNISSEKIYTKEVKRTDTVIDNCHTHVTAVAVSTLAFHLRFVLRIAYLLQ